eukprot:scaffold1046_cov118-Isochrysis_galbana.AAC.3
MAMRRDRALGGGRVREEQTSANREIEGPTMSAWDAEQYGPPPVAIASHLSAQLASNPASPPHQACAPVQERRRSRHPRLQSPRRPVRRRPTPPALPQRARRQPMSSTGAEPPARSRSWSRASWT